MNLVDDELLLVLDQNVSLVRDDQDYDADVDDDDQEDDDVNPDLESKRKEENIPGTEAKNLPGPKEKQKNPVHELEDPENDPVDDEISEIDEALFYQKYGHNIGIENMRTLNFGPIHGIDTDDDDDIEIDDENIDMDDDDDDYMGIGDAVNIGVGNNAIIDNEVNIGNSINVKNGNDINIGIANNVNIDISNDDDSYTDITSSELDDSPYIHIKRANSI